MGTGRQLVKIDGVPEVKQGFKCWRQGLSGAKTRAI